MSTLAEGGISAANQEDEARAMADEIADDQIGFARWLEKKAKHLTDRLYVKGAFIDESDARAITRETLWRVAREAARNPVMVKEQ